ncbi:hypothetical protein FB567DRAFT_548919 [Paraphoma chrysanthemicola]|uniref:Uncharacterized protein n=1 Tax=Paraphoma chrysanthemicola TaxID=798071 RepID=A0A8K0VYW5_9PLEO|nr:hypothetical protein FB567DRAFT_548919 [Paraphoma chrysanthemicola]
MRNIGSSGRRRHEEGGYYDGARPLAPYGNHDNCPLGRTNGRYGDGPMGPHGPSMMGPGAGLGMGPPGAGSMRGPLDGMWQQVARGRPVNPFEMLGGSQGGPPMMGPGSGPMDPRDQGVNPFTGQMMGGSRGGFGGMGGSGRGFPPGSGMGPGHPPMGGSGRGFPPGFGGN